MSMIVSNIIFCTFYFIFHYVSPLKYRKFSNVITRQKVNRLPFKAAPVPPYMLHREHINYKQSLYESQNIDRIEKRVKPICGIMSIPAKHSSQTEISESFSYHNNSGHIKKRLAGVI